MRKPVNNDTNARFTVGLQDIGLFQGRQFMRLSYIRGIHPTIGSSPPRVTIDLARWR
jgi:hypothetical protein